MSALNVAAGAAVIRGPKAVVLTNQRGAVMQLSSTQTELMVNLDLNGMALSLKWGTNFYGLWTT